MVLAAAPAWSQQLYKWLDDAGKVHYSDQPPPETAKSKKTLELPRPSASAKGSSASAPKSTADLDMEFRKRRVQQAEAEQKGKKEAEANAEKQRNCQESRNRLASLEHGGRITRYGPNGEQQFLTDEEIGREIVAQRKTVDSWCN
jgi:hypothetical protein